MTHLFERFLQNDIPDGLAKTAKMAKHDCCPQMKEAGFSQISRLAMPSESEIEKWHGSSLSLIQWFM